MDARTLWLKCENLQDLLMYLEVCFQNIKSHGAFWKMMQTLCLPKCITLFFSMIPSGYPPNTCQVSWENIKTTCQFLHLVTCSKGETLQTNIPQLYLKQPFISKTPTPPMYFTLHGTLEIVGPPTNQHPLLTYLPLGFMFNMFWLSII